MKTFQRITLRLQVIFISLFIFTISFPYQVIPDIGKYISRYFEKPEKWIGDHILRIKHPYTTQIISDSTGMYIHLFIIVLIALFIAIVWSRYAGKMQNDVRLRYGRNVLISYYLSMQLLIYGFDKVFKQQFYLPEPNTLFTPLGQFSKDILYWSTMGSSWSYSVFAGMLEIIPALLLLFRRTRTLGAMIATMVLINVVAINFSFDISVKLYSCFLLFLAIILSLPGIKKLYFVFIQNKIVNTELKGPVINSKKHLLIYSVSKSLIIGCLLYETLFIYFKTGNFNDDLASRPFLHGAYDIEVYNENNDTLTASLNAKRRLKRIFIHKHGYFITQSMTDEMVDYKFEYDFTNKKLELYRRDDTGNVLYFIRQDSVLFLKGKIGNKFITMQARQIDTGKLPLLQNSFHWTIDDYERE